MNESPVNHHESQTMTGVVEAQLPGGLYRVVVQSSQRITAHVGDSLERNFVRVLVGDHVVVELATRDRTRGRIVRKL